MKLKDKSFEDVIVGAEKEMDFSIDTDNHLIFEILRDKMYKDKIGSICREVLSNSRDANRESGSKENVSVTIIEPNQIIYVGHQSVSFKDNGIGITPERMADIYVKYAASTKTGSDKQTGGFGLGAKTPFAYNDTFTVVTVCDFEGKRMKYFYTALIDSSRKGKMILFDTEESTEPTGTEVIVPIKTPEDRDEFERKAFYYSKYWGCVDYKNFYIDTEIPKIIKDTPEYFVIDNEDACLIIDGIPYPLETNWGFENLAMQNGYCVGLKFNTGDLTISANRESVQYDTDTVEAILARTKEVKEDFVEMMDEMVDNFPTYLEACKFKSKMDDGFFPEFDKGTMNYVLAAAIGVGHYSSYMLTSEYKDKTIQFQGRDVVSKIRFEHYRVERVRDKEYNSYSKAKIYKDYESLPLKQLTATNDLFLGDAAKSSRRNETLFTNEGDQAIGEYFWLITKKTLSSEADAKKELKTMKKDFGLELNSYKAVELMPIERKKRKAGKIAATSAGSWNNHYFDLYYNNQTKELFEDEECDEPLDLDKYVFAEVDRVVSRLHYGTRIGINRDKADFMKSEGYHVILINYTNFAKKISKVKGVKLFDTEHKKIVKRNHNKWVKEGREHIARRALSNVSNCLIDYIEVLPEGLIPEYIRSFDITKSLSYNEKEKLEASYNRVAGSIKINRDGLETKLEDNLNQYPMLKSYMSNHGSPETENFNTVKQYIKQVDNYEN